MTHAASILADSRAPHGGRLTSFEITIPRIILAEFNTHRVFSRNSASSRAIPVKKMLEMVRDSPYIPTHWGKNQKGMQAEVEVSEIEATEARSTWLAAASHASEYAQLLLDIGIHKQITNRLLEPFMWHTVIVTSTEWSNFFHLRNNAMAHPDIQKVAKLMQDLYESSVPRELKDGEWHLPLVQPEEFFHASRVLAERNSSGVLSLTPAEAVLVRPEGAVDIPVAEALEDMWMRFRKISVGRCARVSYLTHDGKRDLEADVQLHDSLLKNGHLSPFEHVARPATEDDDVFMMCKANEYMRSGPENWWSGNLRGWVQYRKTIPGEDDILAHR